MKGCFKSFGVAYLVVPIVFYAADAVGHLKEMQLASSFLFLQLILLVIAVLTFHLLVTWSTTVRLSPMAAAAGAGIGLVHWFPERPQAS